MKNYNRYFSLSPEEKKETVKVITDFLASEEKILFAFIFGSFNDNPENLPFHDIDIGIYIREMKKLEAFHYSFDLSEPLSRKLQIPVDIRIINSAPIPFLFHVIRGELIVERDEDARCRFVEWVVRRYLDMEPLYKRTIKEAFAS